MVARKQSKEPTRIWSFHSERPITEVQLVQDLILLSHRHYNNLIEVERDRAEAFRAIREKHVPGMDAARAGFEVVEAEYARVDTRVKQWRAAEFRETGKKTRALPAELKAEYEELKKRRKALGERHRELAAQFQELIEPATEEWKKRRSTRAGDAGPRVRERVNASVLAEMLTEPWSDAWKDIAQLDAAALERQKLLRATSGLPPGCYLLVESAVAQAVKTTKTAGNYPPWFHRFDGSGRVGVQVTGNETFGDVLDGKSAFLRLRQSPPRGFRHDGEFFTAAIRLANNWAEFPVRLHRIPPRDARVKWAWFRIRRVGGERFRYEFQLTLEGQSLIRQRTFGDEGTIEVRFCSQAHPEGHRVATWLQRETGEVGDVVLPRAISEALVRPSEYRSHADAHVDEAVRVMSLLATLAGNRLTGWRRDSKAGRSRSEAKRIWLRIAVTDWANDVFKSRERLTSLFHDWRRERLSTRQDLFAPVGEAARWAEQHGAVGAQRFAFWMFLWALKDRHLRRSAGQMRERAENRRDALYRDAAIELSKRFSGCVLDASDLREQKKTPKTEEESNDFQRMRSVRQNAAPGRCRELFKEVFGGRVTVERSGDENYPGGSRSRIKKGESGTSAPEYVAAE